MRLSQPQTFQLSSIAGTSLASLSSVSIANQVNTHTWGTIALTAGAAGSSTLSYTDGTNTIVVSTIAAAGKAGTAFSSDSIVWLILTNNDAVNAITYMVSGYKVIT